MTLLPRTLLPDVNAEAHEATCRRYAVCQTCEHNNARTCALAGEGCGDLAREDRCPARRFPDPARDAWRDEPSATRYARVKRLRGGGSLRYIDVGDRGGFNGSVTDFAGAKLCAFRPSKGTRLRWVMLDRELSPLKDRRGEFPLEQNDDPRFVWHGGRLYMSTDYYWGRWDGSQMELREVVPSRAGAAVRDVAKFDTIDNWPGYRRPKYEKNWAPFSRPEGLYYVYSIDPHRILAVDLEAGRVRLAHQTEAASLPWRVAGGTELRGTAPPARLADGSYLSTFHVRRGNDYFTGFYRFEGEPPFRILEMSADPVIGPADAEGVCPSNTSLHLLFIQGVDLDEAGGLVTLYGGDNDHSVIAVGLDLATVLEGMRPATPGMHAVTAAEFFARFPRPEPVRGPLGMLTAVEMEAMIALIRSRGCRRLAELGVGTGANAAAILAACPGVESYVGVDVPPDTVPTLRYQRVEVPKVAGALAAGDPRFRLVLRPRGSLDLCPGELGPLDFVFIDGDHSAQAVRHDTELARAAVTSGAICWHDYNNPPAVGPSIVIGELIARGERSIRHLAGTTLAYEVRGGVPG